MRLYQLGFTLLASLWADGLSAEVRDLGTLGGTYSFARDINQSGSVTGESTTVKGFTHAFLWKAGEMLDLGTLAGQSFSMANGLNNNDEVVGYGRSSTGSGQTKAILWEKSGKAIVLPNLKGQSYAQGSDLNDLGEVAGVSGTKAVIWKKRKAVALPSLGGDYSIALGINNSSWVVGNSLTKDGEVHASLWREGKVTDLGTLGGRFSTANSINDNNQIVGSSETSDGEIHAFVWENGEMKDLGPGMIRGLSLNGIFAGERPLAEFEGERSSAILWSSQNQNAWLDSINDSVYSSAFAINDDGTVVGVTEIRKPDSRSQADSGYFHATLWTP